MRRGSSFAVARLALTLALVLSSSVDAVAQSSLQARIESDRLFREGKRLYEAERYKEACAALSTSDELDPAIGTLGLLAACHEKMGDLVAAWKAYLETARRAEAKKDKRAEFAVQQADALKGRIARLAIRSAGQEPGLEVKRDGAVLLPSELGTDVRVNPGVHTIVARATGLPEWKKSVTLKEGERRVVEVPLLDPDARPSARWVPPKWLPWAVGGVGAAGIGVGAVAGVLAITNNDASLDKRTCAPTARVCLERDAALTAATVSTVAISVGAAGVAASAVLFYVAGSRSRGDTSKKTEAARSGDAFPLIGVAPSVGPSAVGGVVVGVF